MTLGYALARVYRRAKSTERETVAEPTSGRRPSYGNWKSTLGTYRVYQVFVEYQAT
jgi:hypothetical protein